MPLIRTADAVVYELHGTTFNSYASTASGSAELRVWRADFSPESEGVAHRIAKEEVFVVVEGALLVTIDDEVHSSSAGDVVIAPAGSILRVDNPGAVGASAWVSTTAGFSATLPDGSLISPPWAN